jgi:hypothetical protein
MGHFTITKRNGSVNEDEFLKIWLTVSEPRPVFYRLYHDDHGVPLFYSMEDMPGTYIEISQATFARAATNIRVRDGKLVEVTWKTTTKLVPGNTGTPCHPEDVTIVVGEQEPHVKWSKKTYEGN